jgi:hypothetical protein
MELYAALTGLGPLELAPGHAPARLPVLERLLARGTPVAAPADWRRWALGLAGIAAGPGELPVGATLAAAGGLDAHRGTWFLASPVHLAAGLSTVRLHGAGVLALAPATAAQLAARWQREFGAEEAALHACDGQLLLQLPGEREARCRDPDTLAGCDLGESLPEGRDGARLRRLMTELQMWLHADPPRSLEGVAVNALWPWGGGRAPLTGSGRWPPLEGEDAFLAAARRLHPDRGTPPARRLAVWRYAAHAAEPDPLARVDAAWLAPLAAALGSGALDCATVHYGARAWRLTHRQRLRFWARPRPWWEQGA